MSAVNGERGAREGVKLVPVNVFLHSGADTGATKLAAGATGGSVMQREGVMTDKRAHRIDTYQVTGNGEHGGHDHPLTNLKKSHES